MRKFSMLMMAVSMLACAHAPKSEMKADEACADHTGMQKMIPADSVATKAFDHKPNPGEKAICAVSGEKFEIAADTKVSEYDGKWYAFCCDSCQPDFEKDPAKFAAQ